MSQPENRSVKRSCHIFSCHAHPVNSYRQRLRCEQCPSVTVASADQGSSRARSESCGGTGRYSHATAHGVTTRPVDTPEQQSIIVIQVAVTRRGAGGAAIFALQHRKPLLRLADALVIPAAFSSWGSDDSGAFIDGQIVGPSRRNSGRKPATPSRRSRHSGGLLLMGIGRLGSLLGPRGGVSPEGFRHPVVLYDDAKNLLACLRHVNRVHTTPGAHPPSRIQ